MKLLITHTTPVPFHVSLIEDTEKFTKTLANVSRPQGRGLIPGLPEYETAYSIGDVVTEQAVAMLLLHIAVGVHGSNVTARICETDVLTASGQGPSRRRHLGCRPAV